MTFFIGEHGKITGIYVGHLKNFSSAPIVKKQFLWDTY
jgi:hypothetical protein